jgi:hypothetical protein
MLKIEETNDQMPGFLSLPTLIRGVEDEGYIISERLQLLGVHTLG